MINKIKKNLIQILCLLLVFEFLVIMFFLRLLVSNYYFERNIYRNSYLILENISKKDKRAEKLLEISKYSEDGSADINYMHAFNNYLFNIDKYSDLQLSVHDLINKNTFRSQENTPAEINNIIEGSKKKDFNGWYIYKEHIEQNNNLWFVYCSFANIMLDNAEKALEEKRYDDFFLFAKATYSYIIHFQRSYPDHNIISSSLGFKHRLFEILIKYYCSNSNYNNCDESMKILGYYQYDRYFIKDIFQGLSYQNYVDYIITPHNAYVYTIMNILLYDIDNIDNIYKFAKNKYYISINFESMKALGIMSHLYWHPIKSYQARKALDSLESDQDIEIRELAKLAKKKSLNVFFKETFNYATLRLQNVNKAKKENKRHSIN
ncbi:MAG: hypothetical protein A2Y62_02535 [Candidatus Fischerbacteria bacterium RBG_13_37_8]|uniref:Uncharacterized protein n=1 Tax=Candidatus Fischerbacteria bacterium RBG_13_37_8 TaxID=1817863 RepID=A0A1F5VNX1_9BACT|nr:MAG: hypothetical protein A2Y62_02535 [Candidatus Fischerbacteria bacterium RBG_13_37_8]